MPWLGLLRCNFGGLFAARCCRHYPGMLAIRIAVRSPKLINMEPVQEPLKQDSSL